MLVYLMAQQRRPAHRVSSSLDKSTVNVNAAIARRKLQSRRAISSRRRVFAIANSFPQSSGSHASVASSSPPPSRAVLVPLHFNLRRLPSRILIDSHHEDMRDAVSTGSKRKRVNGMENTQTNGRSRSASRVKRRKASRDSSDEDDVEMEIDRSSHWDSEASGSSGEEDDDSCMLSFFPLPYSLTQINISLSRTFSHKRGAPSPARASSQGRTSATLPERRIDR